ncbi:MAG: hypothetical protein QM811_17425 [Pirellulales bacterium]
MRILSPGEVAPALCGASAQVCVKGDEAFVEGVLAERIFAKIYVPPAAPSLPQYGPPSGVPSVAPNADGTWCLNLLGGASAATNTPYPENHIWVWEQYLGTNSQYQYIAHTRAFQAMCVDDLECCPSSSSSSGSFSSSSSSSSSW